MSEAANGVASGDSPIALARIRARIMKQKDDIATLEKERDHFKAESIRLAKENDDIRTKSDSSAMSKRNQELEGRLRTIEHRKVFDEKALGAGIKKEALDHFFELSKYEA